jgi:hypothetical protein
MDNWKIISRIASAFGIIFIIFAVYSAFTRYENMMVSYISTPPASFIQVNVLEAMTPFLLSAVLSFAVAVIINRSQKDAAEEAEVATASAELETAEPQATETP